jgi:hypothetical protein
MTDRLPSDTAIFAANELDQLESWLMDVESRAPAGTSTCSAPSMALPGLSRSRASSIPSGMHRDLGPQKDRRTPENGLGKPTLTDRPDCVGAIAEADGSFADVASPTPPSTTAAPGQLEVRAR